MLGGALSSFTGNADVTIAAHSLGNMVVSHAIQDGGFRPTRYYSVNAAVAREAYSQEGITHDERTRMVETLWKLYWNYNPSNSAEPPLRHLLAANWHELFLADDNRSKLTWKNRFQDVKEHTFHYNFYSAGDDVVRDAEAGRDSASVLFTIYNQGLDFSSFSWAAQEFVKGGTSAAILAMPPPLLTQAGWSLNYNPPLTGYFNKEGSGETSVVWPFSPEQSAEILKSDLVAKPFFSPLKESTLHNSQLGKNSPGSNKAAELKVKYNILARAIPALSFAAATHSIPDAKENFDMEGTMRTDSNQWPTEGRASKIKQAKWLHSDLRDVALLHVYKIYQKFITTGELNQ